jgi:hypothetical protein
MPNHLTMRWSERRTAPRPHFDDFHTTTPSDSRPRPPSLILFSLDGKPRALLYPMSVALHWFCRGLCVPSFTADAGLVRRSGADRSISISVCHHVLATADRGRRAGSSRSHRYARRISSVLGSRGGDSGSYCRCHAAFVSFFTKDFRCDANRLTNRSS